MERKNRYNRLYVNDYIVYFILSLVAGVLITLLLYNFIGFDESNRIMSRDMLLAIKKYNIDIENYMKNRIVIRGIELITVLIVINMNFRYMLNKIIMLYIGLKMGLILTVFVLEMQFIGILNFILITFPHDFIYFYAIIRLYEVFEGFNEKNKDKSKFITILIKCYNYVYIICMWAAAILSETIIKNILIKKLFIVV